MSRRTFRVVAWSYLVKSLLIGLAWLTIPDLPERAASLFRETFLSSPRRP
jgi:hypothetical protein